MFVGASANTHVSTGSALLVACFSAVSLIFGIAHYRGWHRTWVRAMPFDANFFLPAWGGATGLLAVVAYLGGRLSVWVGAVVTVPTLILFAITGMSLVWLPDKLLPEWYRRWRAQGRPASGLFG